VLGSPSLRNPLGSGYASISFNAAPDRSESYRPMSQTSDPLRLTDLPDDTPARLAEIRGGRHLTRRLLALGLRQGSPLCIVQRRGKGLVLASGELRIAIGTGIAEKLWVVPENDHSAIGAASGLVEGAETASAPAAASDVRVCSGDEAA
jgi:ferrous iron transport protein A